MILGALHWLRRSLAEAAAHLVQSQIETLERLVLTAELRDDDAAGHVQRVARCRSVSPTRLGWMPLPWADRRAAPLHDIGKIGIPDAVLFKPGTLDTAEWEVMRSHSALGASILSRGQSEVVKVAERIARSHHEKWDGTGYPEGLRGEAIPIEARVVAVADFFDAMTSDWPYRKAMEPGKVLDEVRRLRASTLIPPSWMPSSIAIVMRAMERRLERAR